MHNTQLQTLCSQVWKKVLDMIRLLKLVHQFVQKTYAVRYHNFWCILDNISKFLKNWFLGNSWENSSIGQGFLVDSSILFRIVRLFITSYITVHYVPNVLYAFKRESWALFKWFYFQQWSLNDSKYYVYHCLPESLGHWLWNKSSTNFCFKKAQKEVCWMELRYSINDDWS